jgi:hypothetical protein
MSHKTAPKISRDFKGIPVGIIPLEKNPRQLHTSSPESKDYLTER